MKLFGIYRIADARKLTSRKESNKLRSVNQRSAKNSIKNSMDINAELRLMSKSFGYGTTEYYSSDDYGVGHLRIKTLNQKGISARNGVICCFSGKLFPFDDMLLQKSKISDSEYVLDSYLKQGLDFIKNLNGVFTFTIFDKKTATLHIVNDRCGMKPVYYVDKGNSLNYASEIKALAMIETSKDKENSIDWDYWNEYFSYGYGLANKTPFTNIKSLSNASILTYKDGKLSIRKYWDFQLVQPDTQRTLQETIDEGVMVLKNVFRRQSSGMKDCMVLLSGGYDSRCIASSLKRYTGINVHAFTIAKSFANPTPLTGDMDAKYARRVAERLGIQYKVFGNINNVYKDYFIKQILDLDGLSIEGIWTYPLMDNIDDTLVNFDGIIGDVLLRAGYLIKSDVKKREDFSNEKVVNSYEDNELSMLLHKKMLKLSTVDKDALMPFFQKEVAEKMKDRPTGLAGELNLLRGCKNKIKIFQMKNRTKNMVALISNNAIGRKIYSIMPFCDNEFVEFALTVPVDMKVRHDIYRMILENAFTDIMTIPTTNDAKNFKERFRNMMVHSSLDNVRYSYGYISSLLRTVKKRKMNNYRLSQNPRDVNNLIELSKIIKYPKIIDETLLHEQVQKHKENDIDPSYFLEPIMQFAIWHEYFVEAKTIKGYAGEHK